MTSSLRGARFVLGLAGLLGGALAAGDAGASVPPPKDAAPKVTGFGLFAAEPVDEIADDTAGDPSKPLSLRLVAPRNGTSSDLIVARDATLIRGLRAAVSDFKLKTGSAVLPATAFQVRYAAREGAKNRFRPDSGNRGAGGRMFYDDLVDTAPATDSTLPIWLTANVPAGATPGEYAGTLTVTTPAGKTIPVPATLLVSPWKCPDPKDFLGHVGLIESPESVALKYKVPLWSARHFELIGGVFKYLGQIGNKVLTVSAIENTQLGNYQSMLRLVKGGGPGAVDFSLLDRYLELYAQCNAPPDVFFIYVWDNRFDMGRDGKYAMIAVSVVDRATGAMAEKSLSYNTAEARAYFQAVMNGVRERVKRRGWRESCIMYGTASDGRPSEQTVKFFQEIAPYARWTLNTHGWTKEIHGVEVGYAAWCRGGPPAFKGPGWANPLLEVQFMRDKHDRETGPLTWRYIVEESLASGHRGEGRIGADFWHVLLPGGKDESEMDNRGGCSGWTPNLMLNCSSCAMLAPGPNGAVSTARFEMLRESLQDCEARIALEKALLDANLKEKLGPDLVKRVNDELKKRGAFFGKRGNAAAGASWHDLSATLCALAAETQQKIGGAP